MSRHGRFIMGRHICPLPFMLHPSQAWLGRVWQCGECYQDWEIIGLVGHGEHGMDVSWRIVDPLPDVIDAETAEKLRDEDDAYRDQVRES